MEITWLSTTSIKIEKIGESLTTDLLDLIAAVDLVEAVVIVKVTEHLPINEENQL